MHLCPSVVLFVVFFPLCSSVASVVNEEMSGQGLDLRKKARRAERDRNASAKKVWCWGLRSSRDAGFELVREEIKSDGHRPKAGSTRGATACRRRQGVRAIAYAHIRPFESVDSGASAPATCSMREGISHKSKAFFRAAVSARPCRMLGPEGRTRHP